jgi:hypothetical protein
LEFDTSVVMVKRVITLSVDERRMSKVDGSARLPFMRAAVLFLSPARIRAVEQQGC